MGALKHRRENLQRFPSSYWDRDRSNDPESDFWGTAECMSAADEIGRLHLPERFDERMDVLPLCDDIRDEVYLVEVVEPPPHRFSMARRSRRKWAVVDLAIGILLLHPESRGDIGGWAGAIDRSYVLERLWNIGYCLSYAQLTHRLRVIDAWHGYRQKTEET